MKVITWNIRGLNNPRKQQILENRLKMEKIDICFIQETKCNMDKMEIISKKYWNNYKFLIIDSQNMMGGILILWKPQSVNLLSAEATRHTLSVKMQVIGNTEEVLCTNVYGPRVLEDKEECSYT